MSEETQEQAMWEAIRQSTEVTDEVFHLAKNYIEQGWAVNYEAYNLLGNPVASLADDAVAWCVLGALHKASYNKLNQFLDTDIAYDLAANVFIDSLGDVMPSNPQRRNLADWNDEPGRTKQEVLTAFEQAIKFNNEA